MIIQRNQSWQYAICYRVLGREKIEKATMYDMLYVVRVKQSKQNKNEWVSFGKRTYIPVHKGSSLPRGFIRAQGS